MVGVVVYEYGGELVFSIDYYDVLIVVVFRNTFRFDCVLAILFAFMLFVDLVDLLVCLLALFCV